MSKASLWVDTVRGAMQRLLQADNDVVELKRQFDALSYTTTLTDADVATAECTAAQFKAALTALWTVHTAIEDNKAALYKGL